jgi:phosphatidylglycerol:prolipoprotein diacylglycerol transferase
MAHPAYWVHTPHPFLIKFGENFGIRYYGLAYLAGFLAAGWLLRRYHRAGRTPLEPGASLDLMLALVIGVIAGGRIGYFLLYQPGTFLDNPLALLRVWEGGMASHGGFVGVMLALWWFARTRKMSFLHLGDLVVSTVPAGLLFGRLANFANGELWGRITTVPWAMIFSQSGGGDFPRHPSQLYEAALEGALLLGYVQWRFWRSDVVRSQPGRLSGEFLVAYALVRAIGEAFREPDASLLFGFSRGTFYSFFLAVGGAILVARALRQSSEPTA